MKIVGMIPVFNSEDILEEVIEHALGEGVSLVVLDNGSTDSSYEICKKFAEKNLIKLKQYKNSTFDYGLLSRILYDMALELKPNWLIRIDQDELLESGLPNVTLNKAVEEQDSKGHNLIQFDVMEFFMTDNDDKSSKSFRERYHYYSWQHDFAYRAWKHIPGTRVEDTLSHSPIFPEGYLYKIPDRKFILRHYRFRNREQAIKNNTERLKRIKSRPEIKIGLMTHYYKISNQKFFEKVDHTILNQYLEDNNWNYQRKYAPFINDLPRREEFFSKDGILLKHYPTIFELKAQIKKIKENISDSS